MFTILLPLPAAMARAVLAFWSLFGGFLERAARERLSQELVRSGDLGGALETLRDGVERALRRGGYSLPHAVTLYGHTLDYAGWYAEGEDYLVAADQMTARWPAGALRDLVVRALATAWAVRGKTDEADRLLSGHPAGLAGDLRWQASTRIVRGQILIDQSKPVAAIEEYRAALVAAGRNREQRVVTGNNLAGALVDSGDLDGAAQALAAAEAQKFGNPLLLAHLAGTRAELELARGDLAAARAALDRSAELKERAGALGGKAWTVCMRARLEVAAGDREAARRLLDEARPILQTVDAVRQWSRAAAALGLEEEPPPLVRAARDPLLDRIKEAAGPLPASLQRRQTIYLVVLGLLLGLAAGWLINLFLLP